MNIRDLSSVMDVPNELKPRRKAVEKTVVRVNIIGSGGKHKSEGPPPDSWSWRKYGQKPIKGSPYPRGYYRCSTSKGCSAKKQVERCKTDASVLIVTYTSTHNHTQTGPDQQLPPSSTPQIPKDERPNSNSSPQDLNLREEQERKQEDKENREQEEPETAITSSENQSLFHYVESSPIHNQEENANDPLFEESLQGSLPLDEEEREPLSYPHLMTFNSTPNSEENDFFEELGELPTPSSFITSFLRSNVFDDRVLVHPPS